MPYKTPSSRMNLRNHVHPFQPEMRGCGQEVAIVRVDFGETIFTGANQVQRIGGTQKDRRGKHPIGARDLFEQVRGERE